MLQLLLALLLGLLMLLSGLLIHLHHLLGFFWRRLRANLRLGRRRKGLQILRRRNKLNARHLLERFSRELGRDNLSHHDKQVAGSALNHALHFLDAERTPLALELLAGCRLAGLACTAHNVADAGYLADGLLGLLAGYIQLTQRQYEFIDRPESNCALNAAVL